MTTPLPTHQVGWALHRNLTATHLPPPTRRDKVVVTSPDGVEGRLTKAQCAAFLSSPRSGIHGDWGHCLRGWQCFRDLLSFLDLICWNYETVGCCFYCQDFDSFFVFLYIHIFFTGGTLSRSKHVSVNETVCVWNAGNSIIVPHGTQLLQGWFY